MNLLRKTLTRRAALSGSTAGFGAGSTRLVEPVRHPGGGAPAGGGLRSARPDPDRQ